MYDNKTASDRIDWYFKKKNAKSTLLLIAKVILLTWLLVFPLLTLATVLEYRAMIQSEYKHINAFVPVR